MRLKLLALPCFLLATALGAVVPDDHAVHEKRDLTANAGIIQKDSLPVDEVISMRIGLVQTNLDRAPAFLKDITIDDYTCSAHPASPNFGHHWSQDEVIQTFSASNETIDAVRQWLVKEGDIGNSRITLSHNKIWFAFSATVQEVEKLLHTTYYHYTLRSSENATFIGCDEYYLPRDIQKHVDLIKPGVSLEEMRTISAGKPKKQPPKRALKPRSAQASPMHVARDLDCASAMVAQCYWDLYGLPPCDSSRTPNPNNTLGVYEPTSDTYMQSDLNSFYTTFAPWISQGYHPIADDFYDAVTPFPGNDTGGGYGEAMLDMTLPMALVYPQTVTLLHQGGSPYYWLFDGLFNAIDGTYCMNNTNSSVDCAGFKPPSVITSSWGSFENQITLQDADRMCYEFLKLALQGTTFTMGSGDSGVGLPTDFPFSPGFPQGCPYVTSVGMTLYSDSSTGVASQPEIAWNGTGGGFSNYFPAPDYQNDTNTITGYFDKIGGSPYPCYDYPNITPDGRFNCPGRGFPDVAMNGNDWQTIMYGRNASIGGTSASSPAFAALINLLNENRTQPIGYLNYIIYEHPEVFNDIVNGSSVGAGTDGFPAAAGWDPVSGLGTPVFSKMNDLFNSLPGA